MYGNINLLMGKIQYYSVLAKIKAIFLNYFNNLWTILKNKIL